jgi:xylulokinase
MDRTLLMAVDLGTSQIKAGVFGTDGVRLSLAREPVRSEKPAPDQFIQHGEDICASVLRCIRKAAEETGRAGAIGAIAFTGQMAGFMGVGENWEDLTGWSCSLDTRYTPFAQRQTEKHRNDFVRISGTGNPLFSAKYAWFAHAYPDRAKRIRKYLMLNGYVIGRLGAAAPEDAVIDGSLLTWTGIADVKNRTWSEEICGELEIDPACLPRIVSSSETVAFLSHEAAKATGLKSGIPLIAGVGDKIAGCVGAGCLREGGLLFEAASFGAVSCMVKDFRPDTEEQRYDLLNGAEPGQLYAHYYMPGSGITQEWFVNRFARKETETLQQAYRRMDEAIAGIGPGSDGVVAVGMLGGTVMPFDGDLRGVFLGHSWSHGPEHFYRALTESFAFSLSTAIDRIHALYPEYREEAVIRVIGGGTRSPNCLQIYADVSGKPLETTGRDEAALWGACILAAKGIGLADDLTAAAENQSRTGTRFEPDPEKHRIYTRLKEQYTRYEKSLSGLCHDRLH